jgi:uncharacterized protein YbbC (DUF1343 family)
VAERVKIGLEVLLESRLDMLRGQRVGLVVNPSSVDADLRHAVDLLHARDEVRLAALFGPQHGIRGETQDNMIEWEGFSDSRTGLPVYSLYGETRVPYPEMLADVDTLVFDMQDVGTRIYTFIYTMAHCMQAAVRDGKRVVVLDRPNPIGGATVEGNTLEPEYASFVGLYPIPTRHGMTVAELARLFNDEFGIGCELEVVPMDGWRREMWFDGTGQPWIMPSPNMPTLDTATVFPGMVHVEGTMVSEGRGTTRPFELVGAPNVDPYALVESLEAEGLEGCRFRPCSFQPTFQKHAGKLCGGLQVHVTDREAFPSVLVGVAVLRAIYGLDPERFEWKQPPYEYVHDRLPFDVIAGTARLREQIVAQTPLDEIAAGWRADEGAFRRLREKYLLY